MKHQKIIGFSILSYLIVIAVSFAQSYFSHEEIIHRTVQENESQAALLEKALSSIIFKIDLALIDLKQEVESHKFARHMSANAYKEILNKRFQLIPDIQGLRIINESGDYVGDAEGVTYKANLSDRTYFKEQQSNEKAGLIISEPVLSKVFNKWTIIFSQRLNYANGNFAGLVMAAVTLDFLDRNFSVVNNTSGSFIRFIRLSDFSTIYKFPRDAEFTEKNYADTNALLQYMKEYGKSGSFELNSSADGKQLITYRAVPDYGLLIIHGDQLINVLSSWTRHVVYLFLFLGLVGVCGGILIHLYLKSLDELEAQKAQTIHSSKLSALGQMAAGIAHEINNPLAIMSGRAAMMNKKVLQDSQTKEALLEFFEKNNVMINRISGIISGLRSVSRDASQDEMREEDLPKIIHNALDLCRERLKKLGIEFKINEIPEIKVKCREVEIVQVLLNLINNSCDAISEMQEKWIHLGFAVQGDGVVISVIDSGGGIPKETLDKLMQPFFTTKAPGVGTGLGLSISNTIIKNHGGKLEYNSQSKNTRFDIKLPIDMPANS